MTAGKHGGPVRRVLAAATVLVASTGIALALTNAASAATTVSNAIQPIASVSAGSFDSGQGVDVVVPASAGAAAGFTAGHQIFILECAAPGGVDPIQTTQCDGDTSYGGGTVTANPDLSIDVVNSSGVSGLPYQLFAVPDNVDLGETNPVGATCGLGSRNDCVLYIGEGGGSDVGMSMPHVFSQVFQIHPDPTDSGIQNPGDGTFPADSAPGAITTANDATFTQGVAGTFDISATGYGPPTYTETGALPAGVKLTTTFSGLTSTGVLSGRSAVTGTFPITVTASNGVSPDVTQAFTLKVNAPPVPTVTVVSPISGPAGGGTSVTITGTNLIGATAVKFGATATAFTVNSATSITATSPAGTGTVDLTVTTLGGTSAAAASDQFTYIVASMVAIQPIAPFSAGTFDSGQGVNVFVSATAGAAAGFTAGQQLFIFECAAPGGVDPTSTTQCDGNTGYAGGTVTVNPDLSIDVVNSSSASGLPYQLFALPDNLELGEVSPVGATCGLGSRNDCVLYIGEGGGSDVGMSQPHVFTQVFQIHPDPTDSGDQNPGDGTFPADRAPGQITTTNYATFTQGVLGTFNISSTGGWGPPTFTETGALPTGVKLTTTFSGLTSTGVLSGTPTVTGTFPIFLTASNGVSPDATEAFFLTVNGPPPTVTAVSPTSGPAAGGTSVTINGTGFTGATAVKFGPNAATGVTLNSPTSITATSPVGSGTVDLTVTTPGGTSSTSAYDRYTYIPAPAATAIFPTSGTQGTYVTLTGTGFIGATAVDFGSAPATIYHVNSDTSITALSPSGSGTVDLTVTGPGGTSATTPGDKFTYLLVGFRITTVSLPDATRGTPYSATLQSAGGIGAVTWKKLTLLPRGLRLDSKTGAITGTPTSNDSPGVVQITISATEKTRPKQIVRAILPLSLH